MKGFHIKKITFIDTMKNFSPSLFCFFNYNVYFCIRNYIPWTDIII